MTYVFCFFMAFLFELCKKHVNHKIICIYHILMHITLVLQKRRTFCVEGEFMSFRSLLIQSCEITLFEVSSLIYYYYECTSHGQKEKLCPVIYVSCMTCLSLCHIIKKSSIALTQMIAVTPSTHKNWLRVYGQVLYWAS